MDKYSEKTIHGSSHNKHTRHGSKWTSAFRSVTRRSSACISTSELPLGSRLSLALLTLLTSDTAGYGIDEVIKIHFQSFAKEFKKASPLVGKMWQHIEAFAWLAMYSDDDLAGRWGRR